MSDWHSWAAVVVFVGAYALIISEKIHRVAVALAGAGLMLAIGATDDVSAFYSEDSGIDWNVIFLLMGMMMRRHHGGRFRAPRQRHHGSVDRPGHAAGL